MLLNATVHLSQSELAEAQADLTSDGRAVVRFGMLQLQLIGGEYMRPVSAAIVARELRRLASDLQRLHNDRLLDALEAARLVDRIEDEACDREAAGF